MRRWLRLSLLGLSMLGFSMPAWGAQARAYQENTSAACWVSRYSFTFAIFPSRKVSK